MFRSSIVLASTLGLALGGVCASGCGRDVQAITPDRIAQQYGVEGAYTGTVATADGSIHGTVVPVTLADGRKAQLVIPLQRANEPHGVYMRDSGGVHPIEVSDRASRADVARSPSIIDTRPERTHAQKRSWEKDALIVGGSAAAGTAIGAVAGGRKGAAIGATAGGVGGLIYDLATRNHDTNRN